MIDPLGKDRQCLGLVPFDECLFAAQACRSCQCETTTEFQRRPLRWDEAQFVILAEKRKALAIRKILFGDFVDGFKFFARAQDPVLFFFDEIVDVSQGRPPRRADGETAVPLDDERNGAAFGADEGVDLNCGGLVWHDEIIPSEIKNPLFIADEKTPLGQS